MLENRRQAKQRALNNHNFFGSKTNDSFLRVEPAGYCGNTVAKPTPLLLKSYSVFKVETRICGIL